MKHTKPPLSIFKTVFLVFVLIEVLGVLVRLGLQWWSGDLLSPLFIKGIYRSALLLFTAIALYVYQNRMESLWRWTGFGWKQAFVLLGVCFFFVLNNYFIVQYDPDSAAYSALLRSRLGAELLVLAISSIWEELLYRGFVQSYIDHSTPTEQQKTPFTLGNYSATFLMLFTHLGFLGAFSPIFAGTSLLLVLIFSLASGWIRSTVGSLWICIAFHIACNWIHVFIHAFL